MAGLAGALDQRLVEDRGDVLCFTSEPLAAALEIAGRVRLTLHAAASAHVEDTIAKLVAVEPDGAARWLAEGIARAQPGAAALEVELGAAGTRLAPGTRLRVEVAGSSLPRFARCFEGKKGTGKRGAGATTTRALRTPRARWVSSRTRSPLPAWRRSR